MKKISKREMKEIKGQGLAQLSPCGHSVAGGCNCGSTPIIVGNIHY